MAKFTSSEGYTGARAQQAQGVYHKPAFLSLTWKGPCSLYSDWLSSGAQSARCWLMLHLEFRGGVDSNFSTKTELCEQESGTVSSQDGDTV
jgi:hypothetical protein